MRRLLAPVSVSLLVAAACSGGGDEVPVDEGGDGGGDGAFVAALSAQPDQLDPHKTTAYASFQVLENVYDTLVVPDAEGATYQPSLAETWDTTDDGRTWTFNLRSGVTFHDGSRFDAADVVYSFDRIIDQDLGDAYKFDQVDDIVASDEGTVEFRLAAPVPNLLDLVGNHKSTAILPEGAADEADLATEANGTGPFRLTGSTADAITLEAFDDYWGDGPAVGSVEFRFMSEPTTALTALETGEIDWTDNVPVQRLDDLEGNDDVEVGQVPSFDYWYMALNFAREPFDRPEVREAIALALDRQAIADAAQFGLAEVNETAIPRSSAWHHEYAPYERDVDAARELLDEAGVGDDLSLGLMVTDEYPETVEVAEVVEANLGDVGIGVSIETEQFSTWLDRQSAGDFDAFMLGWLGNIDPYGYYHAQHVCGGENNYQGYCDRETDQVLEAAAAETDGDERQRLYDQAAERIVDANSYIYLYNPSVLHAWSADVSGYEVRPDKAVNLEAVSVS